MQEEPKPKPKKERELEKLLKLHTPKTQLSSRAASKLLKSIKVNKDKTALDVVLQESNKIRKPKPKPSKPITKQSNFAPGIPNKKDMGQLPPAPTEQEWDVNIQRHETEKAPTHHDLRLSPPNSDKAFSWALPKGLPSPGNKHLAVRTALHTKDYMGFSGEIEKGYGKGKVKSELEDKAEVLKSIPEKKIYFNLYKGRDSERYMLMKWQGKDWMLYNYTPTEKTKEYKDVPTYKESYESLNLEDLDPDDSNEV